MLRLRRLRRRRLDRAARRQCPYSRRRRIYGGYIDPPHVVFAERDLRNRGGGCLSLVRADSSLGASLRTLEARAASSANNGRSQAKRMSSVRVFYRTWNAAPPARRGPQGRASWARTPGEAAWRRLMRRRGADAWARRWVLRRAVCELGTRRLGRGEARRGARRGRAPGERSPGVD